MSKIYVALKDSALVIWILVISILFFQNSYGQSQTFPASGSFIVPAGVTTVTVEAWGGGGAGGGVNGGSPTRAGGGGSGGTYTKNASVAVTPGASIIVTVGIGGNGVIQADGGSGKTSSFLSVSAIGGAGGKVGTGPGNYGAGGGTSIGLTQNGGTGAAAIISASGGGGGGAGSTGPGGDAVGATAGPGGAGGGGTGANGLTGVGNGTTATALSGGGSGGRSTGNTDRKGGDGAKGQVIVSWSCPTYSIETNTLAVTPICAAPGTSVITLTSSAAGLPVGNYTVTYNRSSPSATGLTAAMTVTVAGTGTFTAAGLTTAGNATITVTNLASGGISPDICSSAISSNNTVDITVNPLPTVNAGGATAAICQGGTTGALGGSFGGAATGAIWSDGGAGGTFANNGGSTPDLTTYTASASSGTTVTLKLTTSGGSCSTTFATKSLTVNKNPTVNVGGATAAICQNGTTAALGGSFGGGATGAVWSDGGAGGTFTNNAGNTPGTTIYKASSTAPASVTLTLTTSGGSCGTTSDTKTLTVNPLPTVDAGGAIAAICQGAITEALGGSFGGGATGAVWSDGGAGGTFANNGGSTPDLTTYTASASSGTTVTLKLTTSGGSCSTTFATKSLTVNKNPTVNVGGATAAICQNGTTAALGGSFGGGATGAVWSDGGAGGTFTNNAGNTPGTTTYKASSTAPASVTLTLTTSGGSCGTTSDTKTLTVNPLPTVDAGGAIAAICQGAITEALGGSFGGGATGAVWSDGGAGGTFANNGGNTPDLTTYTASASSGTSVTLKLTTSGGSCSTTFATKSLTVNKNPTVNVGGATAAICQNGTTAALGGSFGGGATSAVWSDGGAGGTFINNAGATPGTTIYQASASSSSFVTLTLTTSGGSCGTTSDTKTLTVNPNPTVDAGGAIAAICQGGTTGALGGSFGGGATSAVWSDGGAGGTFANNGGGSPGTTTYTASVSSPTPVTLTLTTIGGSCSTIAASKSITVNPLPTATIIGTTSACQNDTPLPIITFTGANGTAPYTFTYKINSGSPQTVSTSIGNSVTVTAPTSVTGIFTYTLLGVEDASSTTCSQSQTGSATITVNEPAVIITQPDPSQSTCATYPITFTVGATGTALTYQWYKNGSPLSDNSNISGSNAATLNLDQAGTGDAGTYYVIVTGSSPCGYVQSDNAVLTVNQEIFITTQPTAVTLCAGAKATFTVAASGTGISYQWRRGTTNLIEGGRISGSTTATLTITNVNAGDAATNYNVVLTSPGGACPQANSANVKLTVNPIPVATATPASKTICSGTAPSIALTSNVAGTTFTWTEVQTGVSGASASSGSSIAQILTATGTVAGSAVYTVIPSASGCPGTPITVTITVDPTPNVMATPAAQTICSGTAPSIALTSNVTGATFSWTVVQTGVSGASASNGSTIAQTLTATGTVDGTAVYTITPSAATCNGTPLTVTITVHPTPTVTATPASQTICSGAAPAIALTSNVSGATFSWTVVQTGVSGASASGGSSIAQTLTATGTIAGTAVYTITPTASLCDGTPITVTITVNPTPTVTATPAAQTICSGAASSIALTSNVTGATFSWTVVQTGVSGATASSGSSIAQTLNTTGTSPGTAVYTITPSYTNAGKTCTGTAIIVTITVNPNVTIAPLTQTICNAVSITPIAISGVVPGSITSWTRDNTGTVTGIAAGGSGTISGILTNSTATAVTVTFSITATATNGCVINITAKVIVDAAVIAPVVSAAQTVCVLSTPASLTGTPATGGNGSFTYQWQSSLDNTNWSNIAGATGLTYQPPFVNLGSDNTYYRLRAIDACATTFSNTIYIEVVSNVGFTFSIDDGLPSNIVCPGTTFTPNISSLHFANSAVRYTWSTNAANITPSSGGPVGTTSGIQLFIFRTSSGNIGPLTTINTTNVPVTTTVSITPNVYDYPGPPSGPFICSISPQKFDVIINPTPQVNTVSDIVVCKGATVPAIVFSGNVTATGVSYTWSSSNAAVGLAPLTGTNSTPSFTATNTTNAPISTTITVTPKFTNPGGGSTCTGTPKTFTITVNPKPIVTATPASQTICSGTAPSIALTSNVTGATFSWNVVQTGVSGATASSGSSITQTLTTTGTVVGTAVYTITPSANLCDGTPITVTITVNPSVTAGVVSGTSPICIGASATYTNTGNATGTWSSSNTGVATVNASTGVVTGAGNGTANIIYTISTGCNSPASAFQAVTVSPNANSGTISGASPLCINGTSAYTTNGDPGGTWSSTNTAVATVSTTGLVTAVSAGTSDIKYLAPGCNGTPSVKTITVSPNANAGVISGTSPLCIGATALYTSNGDAGGAWTSTNTAVATVDAGGLVTAVSAGTSNITYTVSSGCNSPVAAFKTVTVGPNANAGTVSGPSPICLGAQVGYSSSGGDAGGAWSSSDAAIATANSVTGIVKGVGIGSATITYTVTSGCNPPVSSSQVVQVLNPAAASTAGPIAGPVKVCAASAGFIYSIDPVANASTYVWTVPAGWSITAGAGTVSITVTSGATGGTITVKAGNTCGFSGLSSLAVTATALGQWIGATPNWNDAANWCSGTPPDGTIDVTIPFGTPNDPVISTATARAHSITIAPGVLVTVTGETLQIAKDILGAGIIDGTAGTLEFNGTAAQTISGSMFSTNTLNNLTVSNPAGLTVTGGAANILNITGALGFGSTVNNATLNTGDNIVLISTATATAMVSEVKNGNNFDGKVTVERYYEPHRAWRLVTSPLSGAGSIFSTWQINGVPYTTTPFRGTYVTGPTAIPAQTNGLDVSPLNNTSLKIGSALTDVVDTKNTFLSTNTGNADNKGFFIFVRGDRRPGNFNIANSNRTTLSSIGKLQTGDQSFPISPTSGAWTLIGNPYAAPVDYDKITKTDLANFFYVYDPNINATQGAYILMSPDPNPLNSGQYIPTPPSTQTGILQSSQAFFVQSATGSPSIKFTESSKSTVNNQAMFRPMSPQGIFQSFRSNLYLLNSDGSTKIADGNYVQFDSSYSPGVDLKDALKFGNVLETFGLLVDNTFLALNRRPPLTQNDTLFFKILRTKQQKYQFEFTAANIARENLAGFVEDKYLSKATPINMTGTTKFDFEVTADKASAVADRFKIVFKPSVVYTSLAASPHNSDIAVEWNVANEQNIRSYDIERSIDGINFTKVAERVSSGNSATPVGYNWLDVSPALGYYYYRIRSTSNNNVTGYSNVVKVKLNRSTPAIYVFPNPVTENTIHLQMNGMPKGVYAVRLINTLGQVIGTNWIGHLEGTATENIKPNNKLLSGIYQLEVTTPDKKVTVIKVVVK